MSHDQSFKELLQAYLPEFFAAFFPEIARRIDWSHVEFQNVELFTSGGQGARRAVDVVARVRARDGQAETLLVHVEIEADPRADFPERMWEYYCLLRLRDRMPVLPVAVYLKGGPGGVTWGHYEERTLDEWFVQFRYHLVPLPDIPRESLPADNPVTHVLAPLLAGRPEDPLELLVESLEGVQRTARGEDEAAFLVNFLNRYVPLTEEQVRELERRLDQRGDPEVRQMTTIWHELGRAEGRAEGWAEGRAEGRADGMRRIVQRVLITRFGDAPPQTVEALEAIRSEEVLEELAGLAATAGSLDEFMARIPADAAQDTP